MQRIYKLCVELEEPPKNKEEKEDKPKEQDLNFPLTE